MEKWPWRDLRPRRGHPFVEGSTKLKGGHLLAGSRAILGIPWGESMALEGFEAQQN